jgi:hypothetical protein
MTSGFIVHSIAIPCPISGQISRVVDPDPEPDPDWIRILRLCGSGSVFGIRIPDPDPGARKLRNISVKMQDPDP